MRTANGGAESGALGFLGRHVHADHERPAGRADTLLERLDASLRESGLLPVGASLTIAFSGGLDSSVLLDLLRRLQRRWAWKLTAAHFDHAMRDGSAEDAAWARLLCVRLGVPCLVGRAERAPRNEAEARAARYAFLLDARANLGCDLLVTAHHADDQAETVLIRLLRGASLGGLAGMSPRRAPGVVRPLLGFWRRELEAYAAERGLEVREDATNVRAAYLRNRVRHELLPRLEKEFNPRMRETLVRLAEEAGRARRVWYRFLREVEPGLSPVREPGRIVVAAPRLLEYDEPTRAELLRRWAASLGVEMARGSLRAAQRFLKTGRSGGSVDLSGELRLRREYATFVLERVGPTPEDVPLTVPAPDPHAGEVAVGGRRYAVAWGGETPEGAQACAAFHLEALEFPLVVRGWRPGDRIVRAAGSRKLKRLFGDRRIPRSERSRLPVLADARGRVLWVPGVERSVLALPRQGEPIFHVAVSRLSESPRDAVV
ncbi:MAG: tRNA lysidine(34) synthetase TilS [Gemmatimonadetes bacterium]|nr:tRNA lysidine(34) synthetase TilS [Gemmatimonadota bacterium]